MDKLYSIWPEELDDKYWNEIFENLESGVEHFPHRLLSNKPDYDMWYKSREYTKLKDYLDDLNRAK